MRPLLRALDVEVATRAAVAAGLPLVVLLVLGRIDLAAYASFGGMTALYGRSEPYRTRLRTVTCAGIGLVVSIAFGASMAAVHAPILVVAVSLLVVITLGMLAAATFGLFPPTPIFFVFAFTVCSLQPTPTAELGWRILLAIASATFAWLLVMSGWMLRRTAGVRRPTLFKTLPRRSRYRPAAWRDGRLWLSIAQNLVGVIVAGWLATLIGAGHSYWAVVSVVAVLPPPRAAHSIARSVHRIVGTALGVVVTALVLLPGPPPLVVVIVIALAQFGAEILVGRHYGAALLFITPLAISVSHLATPVPVPQLLLDRVIETALGASIGLLIVLATRALDRGRAVRA
ncbi:FUSC family protein [Microbacterium sp. STN6]|uniref:FUSC family protein n=1 Tax=Microbacterium sp. STN6 TaxID=2995588 RepID=UPI002260880C|nr:FUSC family protein [Microbacterium sp. STN6]MCX7523285.1 FUSC family protein [Microbacterium sp. STN6]